VVADIADIAKGDRTPGFGLPASSLVPLERAPLQAHEGGYYIRLSLHDRPGAAAAVAMRMAESQISLESIIQRSQPGANADAPVPVTFITHATHEDALRRAVDAVVADGHIAAKPQVIRIERE
jgi:homoserine dehydrogenase